MSDAWLAIIFVAYCSRKQYFIDLGLNPGLDIFHSFVFKLRESVKLYVVGIRENDYILLTHHT